MADEYDSMFLGEYAPFSDVELDTEDEPKKTGPVVNKRKREGIQLCKVLNPDKPPKWKRFIIERKLDCYRCIARIKDGKAELLTSTGLPHWNVGHIAKELDKAAELHACCDNIVLDGEIVHNTLLFDEAGGLLRTHESDPLRADGFVLHVWDILPVEEFDAKICTKVLSERKLHLKDVVGLINEFQDLYGSHIDILDWYEGDFSDVEKYAREFVIEDGEEGIVLKDANGLYEYRKSGVWLKWKPKFEGDGYVNMKEGDFKITGIKMGKGKHQGRVGAIFVEGFLLNDGNIAPELAEGENGIVLSGKAGTGFDDNQREQFLKWFNEGTLVGRTVEIRYQQLSSKGKVRFPVFYRLRPDKDEQ